MHNKTLSSAFTALVCVAQLAACSSSQSSATPQDQFSWAVANRTPAPNGEVVALVETGKHKTGDASPLHRVSIQTIGGASGFGNERTVWESQVRRAPAIFWSAPNTLLITQDPYLVLEYEPEVTVGERDYAVDVSVIRNGP